MEEAFALVAPRDASSSAFCSKILSSSFLISALDSSRSFSSSAFSLLISSADAAAAASRPIASS